MKSIDINGCTGSSKSISCAGGVDQNWFLWSIKNFRIHKGRRRKVSGTVGVDMIGGENEKKRELVVVILEIVVKLV